MAKQKYSDEFKQAVLETYQSEGPAAAARRHGVSKRSVQSWAKRAGVCTEAATKSATEAACVSLETRRSRIRELLGQRAQEMLDRMGEPMQMWVGSGAKPIQVELERPPAGVCKDLATTAAILIDKLQLMTGEATERVEHNDLAKDARERLTSRIASIASARRADEAPSKPD